MQSLPTSLRAKSYNMLSHCDGSEEIILLHFFLVITILEVLRCSSKLFLINALFLLNFKWPDYYLTFHFTTTDNSPSNQRTDWSSVRRHSVFAKEHGRDLEGLILDFLWGARAKQASFYNIRSTSKRAYHTTTTRSNKVSGSFDWAPS